MTEFPTGTVTLLFTDIEGSTKLLRRAGARYPRFLQDHNRLLREAFTAHRGHEVDTAGDGFLVAFSSAEDAVAAAAQVQLVLAEHAWPEDVDVRVRIGIHTGHPGSSEGKYVGLDVHRAARIMAAGHGGQVLVSQSTQRLLDDAQAIPLGE